MKFWAWILSALFPLCGTFGATGITPPGTVNYAHLSLQGHSEFLAGPVGFFKSVNQVTPLYNIPPASLFAQIQPLAATQPHTFLLDSNPQTLQAAYVLRTPLANFPDILTLAIIAEPGGKSGLILYSHSIYGAYDYGQNRQHVAALLHALNLKVSH